MESVYSSSNVAANKYAPGLKKLNGDSGNSEGTREFFEENEKVENANGFHHSLAK